MIERFYDKLLQEHIANYNQMLFLSGPRQVGKTTLSKLIVKGLNHYLYLNWDLIEDREVILSGPSFVAKKIFSDVAFGKKPVIIFDEIHKYSNWKGYIKGFYDTYRDKFSVIVTGSAKLDVYQQGGDSLMGRYFYYRVHPLSVSELCNLEDSLTLNGCLKRPKRIEPESWKALLEFGGFPDPFINKDPAFYNRWQLLRHRQLFKEDLRDISRVYEVSQMEVLAKILDSQIGQITNYSKLASKVRVSDKTIRNWIEVLRSLYFCFMIKPWTKNITRSLLKEPKIFLWDWSAIDDQGMRVENFVASHLLKAVHYWTDAGLGKFALHFVRDLEKREVDFLLTRDDKPWMLIEVKSSYRESLSKNLLYFNEVLQPEHCFQLAYNLEYQDIDVFTLKTPHIVSMQTFLSQLV
ncbi:MAG: ATP-binding protein [Pseudomonadota bacterium]